MSPGLIVSLALRILVLAGIGGCIVAIRKNASASERHLLWMLTLAAIVVLPVVAAVLPEFDLVTLPAVSASSSTDLSPASGASALWPALITAVWLAGSLLYGLSLLMSHARVRRIVRDAYVNREWSDAVGSRVLVSTAADFAFNYGVIDPVIVLPERATLWPEDLLNATLIHEAAHIERRDGASLFMAQIAKVIYWWHPAVRYVVREAARERECACDDAVLRVGVSATTYGQHLLANATIRLSDSVALAAPAFSRTDGLMPRIANLLDDRQDHGIVRRKAAYSAVFAALPLIAFVASATPVARRIPVATAVALVRPAFAQAPSTVTSKAVIEPAPTKRKKAAVVNASRKGTRKQRRVDADTATLVAGKVMQRDFAQAAIFPVDLKKFARLAGAMGHLAGQMASSIDSAKMGTSR